ncbi:MAG: enoyl-CoA hydratase/isomerase family protein [Deltaproteobacteria bacterium]|nr:enoyl-CoA hydratase/isomerase family protein [Deltaproteobacteria bacterium]
MTELIRSERRGAVALVTLASPDTLNSLSTAMLQALAAALGEVAGDESLRALVLTGEGRAFAAGADIEEMSAMTAIEAEAFSRLGHETFGALEALAIPTLAAVNGFALGGGCELALACDWIYASTKARFGQPEVKLGLIPGFGGTSRLVRRVGIGWAKELILAAENLKADEAMRIGLVNRVFEPDELLDSAMMAGQAIAERGPLAVRIAKRVLQEGQDADLRLANTLEQNAFGLVFASEDSKEGTKAFLEKRDPEFNGR